MSTKFIVLNGKTYRSVDEMPPDVREAYELAMCLAGDPDENDTLSTFNSRGILADRNRNGIPDVIENIAADDIAVDSVKIIVDGQEIDGIENLPPEARAKYEQAMGQLDANRNGIPDFVEGMIKTPNQTANISNSFETQTPPHPLSFDYAPSAPTRQDKPLPVDSVITPDTSNGWALALAGLLVLLLCAAGAVGVWYYFLR